MIFHIPCETHLLFSARVALSADMDFFGLSNITSKLLKSLRRAIHAFVSATLPHDPHFAAIRRSPKEKIMVGVTTSPVWMPNQYNGAESLETSEASAFVA